MANQLLQILALQLISPIRFAITTYPKPQRHTTPSSIIPFYSLAVTSTETDTHTAGNSNILEDTLKPETDEPGNQPDSEQVRNWMETYYMNEGQETQVAHIMQTLHHLDQP